MKHDTAHEHHSGQSIPNGDPPTQFTLLPVERLVFLIERYSSLRVDAETLPPAPHRPPLSYVAATLAELRRELTAREGEGEAA